MRLAVPASGHGPGVLVLAEGLHEAALVDEACVRLAQHGFVALGWLAAETGPPEVPLAAPSAAERRWVDAGIEQLFRAEACDGARLALLGFGRGGLLAVDAAARGARAAAVVSFGAAAELARLEGISLAGIEAPLLVLVGEKDPAVDSGGAEALEGRLRREGASGELRRLPGAGSGYYDAVRADRYDAVAARAAWDTALARLRAEL